MRPKTEYTQKALSDGFSVNLRQKYMFESGLRIDLAPSKVVFLAYPNIWKMHAKQGILTFLAMPKTPLLMVLGEFWDHLKKDTIVTLLLKSGLRFALGPSEMVFSRIFCCWARFLL